MITQYFLSIIFKTFINGVLISLKQKKKPVHFTFSFYFACKWFCSKTNRHKIQQSSQKYERIISYIYVPIQILQILCIVYMSICSCRLYILHGAIENIINFLKSHNSQQFKSYYKTNRIQLFYKYQ